MKAWFKFITESYSLLENPIEDWVLMSVIGTFAFLIAYGLVGKLYDIGIIGGRDAGHFLHWIIRFIVFAGIYSLAAAFIRVYVWFDNLPDIKWLIIGEGIVAIFLIFIIGKRIMLRKQKVYL